MISPVTVIETPRLRLRPWRRCDVDAAVAMDRDPAVRRFLPPAPTDWALHRARLLDRVASGWPEHGGTWVVEWRDEPGFLGWCGVFPLDNSPELEIGYRYVRAAWGQGVASEAGRPVRDVAFRALGLDRLLAVTDPDNAASQRVLAKLGLERRGVGLHYGRELTVFGLDRAAWARLL